MQSVSNKYSFLNACNFTNNLLDSSTYYINSSICVSVGLNPDDLFWPKIVLSGTPSHLNVSVHFLQRIYSMKGYLSALWETSIDLDGCTLLEDENTEVRCVGVKRSMLSIMSKLNKDHCVLFTQNDLNCLFKFERVILENVRRKLSMVRPRTVYELKTIFQSLIGLTVKNKSISSILENAKKEVQNLSAVLTNCMYLEEISSFGMKYLIQRLEFAKRVIQQDVRLENKPKIMGKCFDIFAELDLNRTFAGIEDDNRCCEDSMSFARLRLNKNQEWEFE